MNQASSTSTRYIPALDGLRGLAILLVIVCHYFNFISTFAFGEAGVDLFFVLSGYLITGRLFETVGRPTYFRTFYRNRILRIFPLYFGTLIVFFIGICWFTKKETQPLLAFYYVHWKSFFIFTENWTFIRFGMPAAPFLLHFWSLAIEEQFYIVWPFLIYCLGRFRNQKKIFVAITGLVILARCVVVFSGVHRGDLTFYYFNTFFRMDSLLIGALLFQVHLGKKQLPAVTTDLVIACGILFIICTSLAGSNLSWLIFNSIGFSIVALTCAGLIHRSIAFPGSFPARFFSHLLLRRIGKISYGLYVIHLPVLLIFRQRLYDWSSGWTNGNSFLSSAFAIGICLLITFSLSLLSYVYFESPFLRLKRARKN